MAEDAERARTVILDGPVMQDAVEDAKPMRSVPAGSRTGGRATHLTSPNPETRRARLLPRDADKRWLEALAME